MAKRPRHPIVAALALGLAAAGCGADSDGGPAGPAPTPPPDLLGNPESGREAFLIHCAQCHSSRDGFDLAAFDFTPFDMVRRGLAHVDSATSRDIAAHIESLDVSPMRRSVAPFQPGGKIRGDRPYFATSATNDDRDFWTDVFGTGGWPAGLTSDALRAIDPREFAVPIAMPLWSLEGSDEDWMPDVPLPSAVLDEAAGALRAAIDAYYASPTEAGLIAAMERFGEVTQGPGLLCWRQDPIPCFDARRWMSSLGAQHYLRLDHLGDGMRVPAPVAGVWWNVGESAIALQAVAPSEEDRDAAFRSGARWMYLAFSYAPDAFREPAEYMGTFLNSQGMFRTAIFATLRRMVGDGPAHAEHPDQFLEDGRLAVRRADFEVGPGLTEFVFGHFVERLEGGIPPGLDRDDARALVGVTWDSARRFAAGDPARWVRIRALHDRVLQLLR